MKIKRVLFICTGNTCRSPMAEIILKNKLKSAGVKGIVVSSAGRYATDGDKMSENSFLALKKLGYKAHGFKSKKLTLTMLLKSDLTVCMTADHKVGISNFPEVYCPSDFEGFKDISDPYGGDLGRYVKTSHEIEDLCNHILKIIVEKSGEQK